MVYTTVLQWFEGLEFADWIRLGSMFIAFILLAVWGDRKTWTTTDILITVGKGLVMLVVPYYATAYLVSVLILVYRIFCQLIYQVRYRFNYTPL